MNAQSARRTLFVAGVFLLVGLNVSQGEERSSTPKGCLLERVQPGSPADAGGLQSGDVIVEASSHTIRSAEDLQAAVRASSGDFPMTVLRESATENIVAHLGPPVAHGFRLGVSCAGDTRYRKIGEPSNASPAEIYIGPLFSRLSLGGDFDGNHVLVNDISPDVAAVTKFDRAWGYGGVLGLKSPLPFAPVDFAIELSYQQGKMDNSFMGDANDKKATFHEFGFTGKGYFYTQHPVQPVLGVGFDIPWLKVPEAVVSRTSGITDESFRGIGLHAGGGACFFVQSQISVEAFVTYHWRHFTALNGTQIDSALNSRSVEPSISVRYHFSFGRKQAMAGPAGKV